MDTSRVIDFTLKEYHYHKDLYQKVGVASQKSQIVRVAGPGLGISLAMASVFFRVCAVAEAIFKGFANIFAGNYRLGAKQLTVGLGFHVLNLAVMAIEGPIVFAANTLGMAIIPKTFPQKMLDLIRYNEGWLNTKPLVLVV